METLQKPKVYVGCGLTHAPIGFMQAVERLKEDLKEVCEVLYFTGLNPSIKARHVYDHDIGYCVANCDLLLAICDYPSLGLGYEMATQVEKRRKPVLAVAHKDAKVSDLVLDTGMPGYTFKRYWDMRKDVTRLVKDKLAELN